MSVRRSRADLDCVSAGSCSELSSVMSMEPESLEIIVSSTSSLACFREVLLARSSLVDVRLDFLNVRNEAITTSEVSADD
jgi:hypothetical protein